MLMMLGNLGFESAGQHQLMLVMLESRGQRQLMLVMFGGVKALASTSGCS